jgi:acyl dehydratase
MRTQERHFTLQDQLAFADLSGDRNPLHVDPIAARRYMFGQPVVHGVHTLLWALDCWCAEHDETPNLRALSATFSKPVVLGERVVCVAVSEQPSQLALEVRSGGVVSTRISCELGNGTSSRRDQLGSRSIIDAFPPVRASRVVPKEELEMSSGSFDLYLNTAETARLFPHLIKLAPAFQIASILGTSRLVGVECPGLHSLFSSLELRFEDSREGRPEVSYRVSKLDHRIGLIELKLDGQGVKGTVTAFRRPPPVEQPTYTSLRSSVGANEFAGQVALIIGGSRGLGEVAAKLLAAGGAIVRITFHQGEQDARRIVDEIVSNGGRADVAQFDVLDPQPQFAASSINSLPTHCYYFATPFIFSGAKGIFSPELFSRFCAYYVTGFANIIDYWRARHVSNFFYPSTVAIDELPSSMGEYSVSKAAGEKLCDFLEKTHPALTIYRSRFPRVATDQTVSLLPVKNQDPVGVMLEHLRAFRAVSTKTERPS